MSRALCHLLVWKDPGPGIVPHNPKLICRAVIERPITSVGIVKRVRAVNSTARIRAYLPVSFVCPVRPLANFSAKFFVSSGKIGAERKHDPVANNRYSAAFTCFNHELVFPLFQVAFAIARAILLLSAASSAVGGFFFGGGSINFTR